MKKVQLVRRERIVTNVRYQECRKNQTLHVGGHGVDGCTKFVASGAEGTAAALACATCGCHRSFHRRVEEIQVL